MNVEERSSLWRKVNTGYAQDLVPVFGCVVALVCVASGEIQPSDCSTENEAAGNGHLFNVPNSFPTLLLGIFGVTIR